jgi:hypothetical protein
MTCLLTRAARRAALPLVGVLALAGCGGSSRPAPVAGPAVLGLQDDALLTSAEPNAWPTTKALHPRVIRYNIAWDAVAPKRPAHPGDPGDPAYQWANPDRLVTQAAAIGAAPLITIVQSPAWANGGAPPRTAPKSPRTFGRFCAAVARRYSGEYTPPGATAPLPRVVRFTIWNEVNRGQYFMPQGPGGRQAPVRYAALVGACEPAIRRENPRAEVAIGPIASRGAEGGLNPVEFLTAYRLAGGPTPQALAFNPYMNGLLPEYLPGEKPADGSVTLRNLDQIEALLRADAGRAVPIWLTEFAWRTAPTPRLGTLSEAQQADLLQQSVDLVRGQEPYVKLLVWFLVRDESPTSYWRSGLVTFDWQHKKAFDRYAELAQLAPPAG